jgi:hypothetical protein
VFPGARISFMPDGSFSNRIRTALQPPSPCATLANSPRTKTFEVARQAPWAFCSSAEMALSSRLWLKSKLHVPVAAPGSSSTDGNVKIEAREASSMDVFRQWIEHGLTSAEDIAKEMHVSKGTVSKWAKRAIEAGWLGKNGREYALA